MKRIKYYVFLVLPLTVWISLNSKGVFAFFAVWFFYTVVPILDLLIKPDHSNLSEQEKQSIKKDWTYDFPLFLAIPIQFGMIFYFCFLFREVQSFGWDQVGHILSLGLMCGTTGINIGHELGHRKGRLHQFASQILLLSSLDMHFMPYHNIGHHKQVATPHDPATARKGEILYFFWFRSNFGSYVQAWEIEIKSLKKRGLSFFSTANRMLFFHLFELSFLALIYYIFGLASLLGFVLAAIFGVILLETVNYIEHYGLLRKKMPNGHYERVSPQRSWNSDHVLGRWMLFELSRHSDHHKTASKEYQILGSYESSPQMPTGYLGMMLLALIPPLWFYIMNKRLQIISQA